MSVIVTWHTRPFCAVCYGVPISTMILLSNLPYTQYIHEVVSTKIKELLRGEGMGYSG